MFFILLLIINPSIKKTELVNVKPKLAVLADNSKSIPFFKDDKNLKDFINNLKQNQKLKDKFTIENFSFGSNLDISDTIFFDKNETNISKAISEINNLNKGKNAPIILLTDGNQTIGNDYEFSNSKQVIYPVVFGDTTKYKDLKISQVNVNKYSYIKNKFPVEVILNYDGNETVQSKFSIVNDGKTVFSEKVQFSKIEKSKIITSNLTSNKEGINYFTASLQKINDEKNTQNNTKNFFVEVINEQSKVVILTSVLHPDVGALKKSIESNKQRTVAIFLVDKFKNQLNDYQLVILYQPNNQFNVVLNQLKQNNNNFLVVSGTKTDWNFINKQQLGVSKKAINETENYGAIYNASFLTFLQADIGFNQFPPVQDFFGEVSFSKDHQDLLFQNINGLQTQQPLLSVLEQNNQKTAILFGEGLWKWRASSFLNENSFQEFDQFTGNLVQYLSTTKKRNRLEINAETLYPANSRITISAFYTDKNYQFDTRASLQINITNKATKEVIKLPFSLVNNSYQISVENLTSGDYNYKVDVLGQNISKYGSFKITDYQVEEQFTHANTKKLENLANKTGGKLFFKNQFDKLIDELVSNNAYFTVQKSTVKEQNLIDWQWILFIIITLFSAEWFIRKYFGKI